MIVFAQLTEVAGGRIEGTRLTNIFKPFHQPSPFLLPFWTLHFVLANLLQSLVVESDLWEHSLERREDLIIVSC